ncbi:hypothetical protein I3F58_22350 [Streptomyces sp. MUM 203J]|uniref:hypothetical protein n=1 Tax=Streptomyces sp. MUM 203J TaxID=2791990 RepID=UPI001F03F116|nr:hypothetical protein [Streptomyces sp. MUM 203J]MCH0542241.1 hypothetical protein [Streptomyces sp. MUM 203J]
MDTVETLTDEGEDEDEDDAAGVAEADGDADGVGDDIAVAEGDAAVPSASGEAEVHAVMLNADARRQTTARGNGPGRYMCETFHQSARATQRARGT